MYSFFLFSLQGLSGLLLKTAKRRTTVQFVPFLCIFRSESYFLHGNYVSIDGDLEISEGFHGLNIFRMVTYTSGSQPTAREQKMTRVPP